MASLSTSNTPSSSSSNTETTSNTQQQEENELENPPILHHLLTTTTTTIPDPSQYLVPDSSANNNMETSSSSITTTSTTTIRERRRIDSPHHPHSSTLKHQSLAPGRGGGCTTTTTSRTISPPSHPSFMDVPHFQLAEDPSFSTDHNVQVLIRIRPLNTREKATQGNFRCLRQDTSHSLTWLGNPQTRFTFDHVACETISQEKLFTIAGLPMVENCMSGYNSCMFAYGQTGSGKTYTMMGEIHEMDGKLNRHCGITPRIFEYLFTRIHAEEENSTDENLKYSCRCSFLEIYNEQITDLLEPSSTNLQIREDMRKGVYVENLTEHEVTTVTDVVKLLLQGSANKRMAATHMNSESSRSHSVFTCVIESRRDIDSTKHLRFGRLNLVDLAGSERQKSSGAEGERLKEAANINKSLSTLGLVIMSLVDVAHGKHRHIPYRDSRLTFLLQDSLGGNSKTTIIANISPSNCSANETLSTLKFAQRAKLIQNNAKVNEDASGDVLGLQRQIQQLKDQLTYVLKHQTPSRSLSLCLPNLEHSQFQETFYPLKESISDHQSSACTNKNKIKCTEMTLAGALRRERMAETAVRRVEAEMEHMNRLVHQREEDAQRNKMILRFREEKIKRLDLLADGLVTADEFLMEENSALYEEIHLLQARIDRNPEVTRFALENIRLLEQLRMYEDFYERGERETLLTEISDLRDQLAEILEECCQPVEFSSKAEDQDMDTRNELENCRRNLNECLEINEKLTREVTKLQIELDKYLNPGEAAFDSIGDCVSGNAVKPTDKHLSVVRADTYNETAFYTKEEDKDLKIQNDQNMDNTLAVQLSETEKELMEARFLVEAMESEQVRLIEELNILQKENLEYLEVIGNEDFGQIKSMLQHQNRHEPFDKYRVTEVLGELDEFLMTEDTFTGSGLQSRLDRMNKDLEEARGLIRQYQDDRASQLFQQKEVEQVCQQVEVETAQTILHLQDSLTTLQQELQERLCLLAEENKRLRYTIASRESEMKGLAEEWEKATLELTTFIADGCRSLEDASNQIEIIVSSFPERENWISEHVGRAAKMFVEKEKTILKLRKSLEDAQKMGSEMEFKLNSLKGATLAITDAEQLKNDEKDRETLQLHEQLSKKICKIQELESMIKTMEDQIVDAEKRAYAAFVVVKRLSSFCNGAEAKGGEKEIPDLKLAISFQEEKFRISDIKAEQIAMALEAIDVQVEVARQTIVESEKAIYASYADTETHLSAILSDIAATFSAFPKLFQDLSKDISAIKEQFVDLKEHTRDIKLKDQLDETNRRLHVLKSSIDALQDMHDSENRSLSCDDSLSSLSDISTSSTGLSGEVNGQESYTRESPFTLDGQELGNMKNPKKNFSCTDEAVWYLRNEVELAFTSFLEVRIQLAKLFDRNQLAHEQRISSYESLIYGNDSELNMDHVEGFNQPALLKTGKQVQSYDSRMEEGEERRHDTREMLCLKLQSAMLIADKKINAASNFIVKFEEAQATMKEADVMLNTLLKANENAKHMTDRWKQAGEELKIEKASLIEEVQRLTTTICLQQEEYGSLEDQFHSSLEEIKNLVSSLEISVHETQRDVEERFKLMYADISSLGQDLLDCICTSRSSLEDISSEIMEKGFALFVMYQCQIRGFSEKILGVSSTPLFLHPGEKGFLPILNNVEERGFREDTSALESAISTEEATPSDKMDYRVSNPRDILFPGYSLGKDSEHKEEELGVTQDKLVTENNSLKKDLARKDIILKGLLFDLSLLQESTSNSKDIKDETEQMVVALTQIQDELALKTTQLDVIVVQYKELKAQLATSEAALSMANSKYEQAQDMCDVLSNQNSYLRNLVNDLFAKKDDIEEQLEDKIEVVKSLEEEILRMALSAEEKILSSVVSIEDELRGVTSERDHLREKVISLKDKLEMANALAEENEAVAVEARQESEASKMYAEQKEEEARILERSVEELEYTINVLEKKVFEMGEEVERHQFKREDLRLATRDPVQRTLAIGDSRQMIDPENFNVEQQTGEQIPGHLDGQMLELHESKNRIRVLEKENAEQAKEIKECRDYISELKLHTDAQSSLYQQKYNMLEAMVRQVKADQSTSTSMALEKTSRSRGSSSPFRCIQGLVQQMNVERDQDLSAARIRIEELEALASRQQKEVCMLHARLAAAESMTHDVIRDLLAVKLDITNYANLVDQGEVQKLVEVAQQQTEEFIAKEHEILKLRKQVNDLMEERQCYLEEKDQRESEILAAQLKVEQLRERDHMLTAQNEMLKMDKANLRRKVTEMDDMVKKQSAKQNILQRTTKMKENSVPGIVNEELSKRLMYSEKLLSNVNNELAWYQKSNGRDVYNRNNDERLRNQRQGKEEDFN